MLYRFLMLPLCLLVIATSSSADPIEEGRVYEAGTRLESPWSGVSFVVPAGFNAAYDPESEGVYMQKGTTLLMVWGLSEATAEQIASLALLMIREQGVGVEMVSRQDPDAQTVHAELTTASEFGTGSLVGTARHSAEGNALAMFALSLQGDDPNLASYVSAVSETIRWSAPMAKEYREALAGRTFQGAGYDSAYSQGGAGNYGSFAGENKTVLSFCSQDRYGYMIDATTIMSIEGASVRSEDRDAHSGAWNLILGLAGNGYLMLDSDRGDTFEWSFRETEAGLHINGIVYAPGQESLCF